MYLFRRSSICRHKIFIFAI